MGAALLHVLDHSLPEQDGYSFRSHSILRELAKRGFDVAVLTGPKQGGVAKAVDVIDGITYRRTALPGAVDTTGLRGQLRTVGTLRRGIAAHLKQQAVDVVHAHSPCLNGLAALGLGRPLLYEMRSSWEDAAVSVGTTTEGSLRYRASRALETFVARRADEVVVICDGLRRDLIARGIPERKVTVVPNALSPELFALADPARAAAVRARFGLERNRVIGFFGSFFEWEGLELLIAALPEVAVAVPDVRLLLAGGGRQDAALRALTKQLRLESHVIFAGRIPHEDVLAFYRAADVTAYPRVAHRLTDMVTPLKPLESMAQRTAVVASDVGGHREQIDDGRNGFLFKAGDRSALARRLIEVLTRTVDVDAAVAAGRARVERDARWEVVTQRYVEVYERMLRTRSRAGA
jgi:PEP-CTERM/exosortase A-associated glycosyltransferase